MEHLGYSVKRDDRWQVKKLPAHQPNGVILALGAAPYFAFGSLRAVVTPLLVRQLGARLLERCLERVDSLSQSDPARRGRVDSEFALASVRSMLRARGGERSLGILVQRDGP
jgi:hypothetical protein